MALSLPDRGPELGLGSTHKARGPGAEARHRRRSLFVEPDPRVEQPAILEASMSGSTFSNATRSASAPSLRMARPRCAPSPLFVTFLSACIPFLALHSKEAFLSPFVCVYPFFEPFCVPSCRFVLSSLPHASSPCPHPYLPPRCPPPPHRSRPAWAATPFLSTACIGPTHPYLHTRTPSRGRATAAAHRSIDARGRSR